MHDMCIILCYCCSDTTTAYLMSVSDKTIWKWLMPRRSVDSESEVQEMLCGHFQQKYYAVQAMIMKIGCMDELWSGLLLCTFNSCNYRDCRLLRGLLPPACSLSGRQGEILKLQWKSFNKVYFSNSITPNLSLLHVYSLFSSNVMYSHWT